VGGDIYEELSDGTRHVWGTVTVWEPPSRTVFTWHPGRRPDTSQNVELRFLPEGSGTRLELTHSGWERLGKLARKARRGYPLGWTYVLNRWAGRSGSPVNLVLDGVIRTLRVPRTVWLWAAGLLVAVNAVSAWIAYGRTEMFHGSAHLALGFLCLVWAIWLWRRRVAAMTSSPRSAGRT
jgi:Activator of Hsp90 ATPase homolog 1-like protein